MAKWWKQASKVLDRLNVRQTPVNDQCTRKEVRRMGIGLHPHSIRLHS